jgi:hypothetical protein
MTNPLSHQLPAVRRLWQSELQDGAEQSRLLNYLPSIYADDPFLDGFLKIFESIWQPLERQMDVLYAYFDPRLTPSEFLPWLSTWVDLALDENWPEARRRDYLTIYMGVQPDIVEDGPEGNVFHFTVVFQVSDPATIDQDRIKRIIEEEKPAHTIYTLQVEKQ